jgi:hypothetical protein
MSAVTTNELDLAKNVFQVHDNGAFGPSCLASIRQQQYHQKIGRTGRACLTSPGLTVCASALHGAQALRAIDRPR